MTGVIQQIPIDPSLSAVQNVFAVILAANPRTTITSALVTLGTPTAWSGPSDDWRNTELLITAKPSSGWILSQTFRYHRVDLSTISSGLSYDQNVVTSMAGFLQQVIADLKVIPAEVLFDVSVKPTPVIGEPTATLHLKAKDNSLAYIGQLLITLTGFPIGNVRLEEDGSVRTLEDGSIRYEDSI